MHPTVEKKVVILISCENLKLMSMTNIMKLYCTLHIAIYENYRLLNNTYFFPVELEDINLFSCIESLLFVQL